MDGEILPVKIGAGLQKSVLFHSINRQYLECELTADDWETIRPALLPATLDHSPAKWVGIGQVTLTLPDDSLFEVWLFETGSADFVPFAAGRTWETRQYYRGGSQTKFSAAIAGINKRQPPHE